jgi:hypothetical protein
MSIIAKSKLETRVGAGSVEVMAALGHDRGARVTPPGGLAAISSASRLCPKLSSQRTLRWRGLDSNF